MIYFILLFLSLFLSLPNPSFAQTELIFQYQNDYQFELDQYQKQYQFYLEKKQVNQKYNTLNTKKELVQSTKTALSSRNQLLLNYLRYLRVKIELFKTQQPESIQTIQNQLSQQETWLESQKLAINQLSDLPQIQTWAKNFKVQYVQIQKSMYSALIQHDINLQLQTIVYLKDLTNIVKNDSLALPESDQWFISFPQQFEISQKHLQTAGTFYQKTQKGNRFQNFYPESKKELDHSRTILKNLNSDLKSIITKFLN
jgi:hypothetical protein